MEATYTLEEVAELVGVSASTVNAWVGSGELRGVNVSVSRGSRKPRMRVRESDLNYFLESRSTQPRRSNTRR